MSEVHTYFQFRAYFDDLSAYIDEQSAYFDDLSAYIDAWSAYLGGASIYFDELSVHLFCLFAQQIGTICYLWLAPLPIKG